MKRTLLLAVCTAALAVPTIAQDLPPGNPLPGECFARVIVPAQYSTSTEQIVLRETGSIPNSDEYELMISNFVTNLNIQKFEM